MLPFYVIIFMWEIEMYKTKEDALAALIEGKTTIRSLQSQICKWRKKKNIDMVINFTYAIEHYRMFNKKD